MPKGFTEVEKKRIVTALRIEGQKLFVAQGLKKVTIDELTRAVHISKGSFYAFYETKEDLFLDISSYYQQELFESLEPILFEGSLNHKERVFLFLKTALDKLSQYPILHMINEETISLLYRKLPQERINEELQADLLRLEVFEKHHIKFAYPLTLVTKLFQSLVVACISLQNDEDAPILIEIMLKGIVEKVVIHHE